VFLPFFNLYCYHLDFSGFQIGVLSGIRSVALVLFPLFWGLVADRFHARRAIYIGCSLVSSLAWALLLFTTQFGAIAVIMALYGMFYAPIISFLEAFTMDALGDDKKSYGRLRACGSISFILTVLVLGKILDMTGVGIIVALILAGSLLQAAAAFRIPDVQIKKRRTGRSDLKFFFRPRVLIFLTCAFLMLVSHGTYYGFYSIHLETLGMDKTFIGFTWALASTAEILVMVKSDRLFARFSLERVLLFSFMVAALRWLILYTTASPVVILLAQVLHAVTYGTFHMASILYIDRLTPDASKTMGQAVNNAVTYGLGLVVGFLLSGALYETLGAQNLFGICSLIAIAAGGGFCGLYLLEQRKGVQN
ncbi:MAG: MFS transporter, partial [Desulfobacterales bacterium]|nr:MFS transporter [Desulfobacterales bacterium]